MTYEATMLALLWVAAPAVTVTPVLYGASTKWWKRPVTFGYFVTKVALALLVDLTLLFHAWPGHIGVKKAIAIAVYVLVALAAWATFYALWRAHIMPKLTARR